MLLLKENDGKLCTCREYRCVERYEVRLLFRPGYLTWAGMDGYPGKFVLINLDNLQSEARLENGDAFCYSPV